MGELRACDGARIHRMQKVQALGEIARGQKCLAAERTARPPQALCWPIFSQSPGGCNAFLGGISRNYDSNLLLSPTSVLIAEADEFDSLSCIYTPISR